MSTKKGTVRLEVLNPSRRISITAKNAPRLDTLNGKTICEAWRPRFTPDSFRGAETFPVIRELLKKRYPDVKIVPYSDFPSSNAINDLPFWAPINRIPEILREKGCDALLVGNGG